jgi:alpha-1,3-rhamnosyl/mannosyltransferase
VAGDGSPYLLCVGDLRAKKNLGRVVAAWQALRASGAFEGRLVIAGQGDVDALGLADGALLPPGLVVTGFLSDADLDATMRGAACVVHASLCEGFGLVVVEAMARGVPVAVADATALPEVAGDACEKFDPLDVDAIAAAILRAVAPARAAELAVLGRARVATFSWDASAAATADVYRELLP